MSLRRCNGETEPERSSGDDLAWTSVGVTRASHGAIRTSDGVNRTSEGVILCVVPTAGSAGLMKASANRTRTDAS